MEFKTKKVFANMFKKYEEAYIDAKSKFVANYGDSDVYNYNIYLNKRIIMI